MKTALLIFLPEVHGKTNSRLQLCRHKMVKTHNCLVKFSNGLNSTDMTYVTEWYKHGRLADGFSWPDTIEPGYRDKNGVLSYERNGAVFVGCSGYVTYKMFDTEVTIAFANPYRGGNALGVGTGGKRVWDDMSNHKYHEFIVNVDTSGGTFQFDCRCTHGSTNTCTVNITKK